MSVGMRLIVGWSLGTVTLMGGSVPSERLVKVGRQVKGRRGKVGTICEDQFAGGTKKKINNVIGAVEESGGLWSRQMAGQIVAVDIQDLVCGWSMVISAALTVDVGKTRVSGKQVMPGRGNSGGGVRSA
jgi:hypothetical protein